MRINTCGLTEPAFGEFIKAKFGPKWVLAHRMTDRLRDKYGDDCVAIHPRTYGAAEAEYREIYGDPYDPARAAMWVVLKQISAHCAAGDYAPAIIGVLADAAIAKERATFTKTT